MRIQINLAGLSREDLEDIADLLDDPVSAIEDREAKPEGMHTEKALKFASKLLSRLAIKIQNARIEPASCRRLTAKGEENP